MVQRGGSTWWFNAWHRLIVSQTNFLVFGLSLRYKHSAPALSSMQHPSDVPTRVRDRLHTHPLCGIFYFTGTDPRYKRPTDFRVSSERHRQSGLNEIAHVTKRQQVVSKPVQRSNGRATARQVWPVNHRCPSDYKQATNKPSLLSCFFNTPRVVNSHTCRQYIVSRRNNV